MEQIPYRFYDIAANLTDEQFGSEKKKKEDDRDQVVERAAKVGCTHLLIAAGCVEDALHAYELCNKYNNSWLTIGVHPCRAIEAY